jgi:hypothetical protein
MRGRLICLALIAAIAVPATAQQWPDPPGAGGQPRTDSPAAKPKPKARPAPRDDVEELTPAQIRRAQEPIPSPVAPRDMPEAVKRPSKNAQARQIECRGAFAKDSSHIRLAQIFGTDNVAYTEVDGPDNSKLMASVLFPRDPQRRLEVLWTNDSSRSGTQVIAINGKSNWAAPRGIKLGTPLATVEKINGKPFKMTAFGPDGSTAASWQDGAMLNHQGGCIVGMRFIADPRAPEDARRKLASAQELQSSDATVRAARPTVVEILIGF